MRDPIWKLSCSRLHPTLRRFRCHALTLRMFGVILSRFRVQGVLGESDVLDYSLLHRIFASWEV